MFRALVYQRSALDEVQVADIGVVSANIKEDKTQKATSKIVCQKIPTSVGINDLLLIYNSKGIFVYWGIITGIDDKTLTCSQFEAFWNDNEMIVAQTGTNQVKYFKQLSVSNVVKLYLRAKSLGYASIKNTMSSSLVPTYTSTNDVDVANNYKGVDYVITDNVADHVPYPLEKSVLNLETFLYNTYNTYNRIIRPHFENSPRALKVECFYPTGVVNGWDYNSKSLFDSWECISNLSIIKEDEDTNTVYVYTSDGATLRGAYTIKTDGTIVQISGAVANRLGWNKTKFVYDSDNVVLDLVKAELPSLQYNHKISFNISFNGEYKFDDFNLGMPIKFYSTDDNHLYDSCLSAWEYTIKENSDDIQSAKFTLGKVRRTLTSKLQKQ